MQKWFKYKNLLIIAIMLALIVSGCSSNNTIVEEPQTEETELETLEESGYYYETEDVALYLHTYNRLPENYITKSEANELGWDSQEGNLWDVADGYVIGGDNFGNREKLLPIKEGRKYYEADVNYEGGYRGADRLVYSDDGLVFYTEDHYESFEQLY
ncbi:MAG: ribonuclease domain-containing protein [Gudongella sp.]|nr:ribonuclease domain-containing protein [Gudongella sp.]